MKYNRNAQVSLVDNNTKLKVWNKTYSVSGGPKVFNLITNLLEFCRENKTEEDIKEKFAEIPKDFLFKIIRLLENNNVLSNDSINKEIENKLSKRLIMYLERNYKDINEVGKLVIKSGVDIYATENRCIQIKKSFENIGIENINKRSLYDEKSEYENKLAILDCDGISKIEAKKQLGVLIKYYRQIYVCFNLKDKIVGAVIKNENAIQNIFNFYEEDFIYNEKNYYNRKILYLLLTKLYIDGFICNREETNVIEVDENLLVDRFIIPEEDISKFNSKYIKYNEDYKDIQLDVDKLYYIAKNEKNIIEYIGYSKEKQIPFITIETKIRDLINEKLISYYASGEDFTSVSIKAITKALREYLNRYVDSTNEFIVAEYGYDRYRNRVTIESVFRLLDLSKKIEKIDIKENLKEKLNVFSYLTDLENIDFECYGNEEYKVYKLIIKSEENFIESNYGEDIYQLGKDLLFDYIGMMQKYNINFNNNIQENKIITRKEEEEISIYSESIMKKRMELLESQKVNIQENWWDYNKYFNRVNIFISKVKLENL